MYIYRNPVFIRVFLIGYIHFESDIEDGRL